MSAPESIKVRVAADSKLATEVYVRAGLLHAADALDKANCTLPGFQYAKALVDKLAAEQQALVTSMTLRFAAKQGVDISNAAKVGTNADRDGLYVEIIPGDLVDKAEGDL